MASRHKTHYRHPGFAPEHPVACNQKHLKLLPLAVSSEWDRVTCAKCLTHKPTPPVSGGTKFWQRVKRALGWA